MPDTQAAVGDRPPPESQRELFARACAAPDATTTILVDAQFLAQWRLHTSAPRAARRRRASMDNPRGGARDAVWWRDFECVPPAARPVGEVVRRRPARRAARRGGRRRWRCRRAALRGAGRRGMRQLEGPWPWRRPAARRLPRRGLLRRGGGQRGHWARHRRDCTQWRDEEPKPAADAVKAFARLRDGRATSTSAAG